VSTKTEFYVGLVSTMIIAFLMPLFSSAFDIGLWPFIGYLLMGATAPMIGHALYLEEKKYLEVGVLQESEEESG